MFALLSLPVIFTLTPPAAEMIVGETVCIAGFKGLNLTVTGVDLSSLMLNDE